MYADLRTIEKLRKRFKKINPKTYGVALVNTKHKLRGGWKRR